MVVCCLGQRDLAFLHMLLHGFFKALLFLGRGVLIHNNTTHRQDLFKMNLTPPSESSSLRLIFLIGAFGMMGAPFLGAFFRKHLILDTSQIFGTITLYKPIPSHHSCGELVAMLGLYISSIITVGYTSKLLFAL